MNKYLFFLLDNEKKLGVPEFIGRTITMHIELSRPYGYIERWIKVYKRMTLLYDYYPIKLDKFWKEYD
jgi:hypothetical protein